MFDRVLGGGTDVCAESAFFSTDNDSAPASLLFLGEGPPAGHVHFREGLLQEVSSVVLGDAAEEANFLTRVVLAEDKVAAASAVEACATWSQFTTLLREKLVVQWQLLLSSKTGHAWLKLVLRVDGHVVILDGNVKQGVFNAQNGELFHGCECV